MNDLGPASRSWVEGAGQPEFTRRMGAGRSAKDAVLGAVFVGIDRAQSAQEGAALANEFWGHMQRLLLRIASKKRRREQQLDCVQSAVASILKGPEGLEFMTEGQFLGYLARRVNWKRHKNQGGYRPRSVTLDTDLGSPLRDPGPGPATSAERTLDGQTMAGRAQTLTRRARYVLFARIQEIPISDQAEHLGVSVSTCRRLYNAAQKELLARGASQQERDEA